MNKLPTEIQNQIFILVDQQDKVECLTVCWEWNQIVERLGLFQIVHIGSQTQFNKLVEKIKKTPTFSENITSLVFDLHFTAKVPIDDVLEYFPNLRELSAFQLSCTYGRYFKYHHPKMHPLHQIQYINTTCKVIEEMQLFGFGVCPNLTKLSIFAQDDDALSYWIGLLENAPALESLSMYDFSFDLLDLEDIHAVLPLLTSLTLTSYSIQCELPPLSDIKPAMSMTSLYIEPSMYDAGDQRNFFEYVAIKYPCLTEFGCNSMVMDLEDLRMERVFDDGFSSILDSIGSRLTTLSLDLDAVDPILIDYLKGSDCQITNFQLSGSDIYQVIDTLATSESAKYIQKLTLKSYSANYAISFKQMTQFIQLKYLCLDNSQAIPKVPINLSELFHLLGDRLETLKLLRFHIVFNDYHHHPETKYRHQEYKLTSLCFDQIDVSSQLYHFVNRFLINLRHLKFTHCNLAGISSLYLPNIKLSALEIIESFPENKKLLVKTLNRNQQRWYTSKSIPKENFTFWNRVSFDFHKVLPSVRSFPFDKFMEKPLITVECNSLVNLFLVNDCQ